MKISLVIPAYNEESGIAACLKSAINNSNGQFSEIIVVDNASTDKTAEVASSFKEVRVVKETRKGVTRARQKGYMEATGDIIAFFDSDTRMPKGWCEFVKKTFEDEKEIVCISGPYRYYDLTWGYNILTQIWYICALPFYFLMGHLVTGGNFAIRKETLQKMDGFDTDIEFYGDDTDTGRRASEFGKVLFSRKLIMPTSGRRLESQGLLNTAWKYGINFFSEMFFKKPVSSGKYKDFR